MIELSRDEINQLIARYLEDEGYIYTLFTFKNEASPDTGVFKHTLPSVISKGVQYMYGVKHLQEGEVVPCSAKFCLSEAHVCRFESSNESESKKGLKLNDGSTSILIDKEMSMSTDILNSEDVLDGYVDKVSIDVMDIDMHLNEHVMLSCWNRDFLCVYTKTHELVGVGLNGIMWRRDIKGISALSWSGDDVVAGNTNGEVITINLLSGRTRSYACHEKKITGVKQRGKGIISSGEDGKVVMMNNGVTEMCVSSKSKVTEIVWMSEYGVGCALDDFSLVYVDMNTQNTFTVGFHSNWISHISHREGVLSSSSHDGSIGIWSSTLMNGHRIQAHEGAVNSHAWINDSVASCGADGVLKTWNVHKGVSVHASDYSDGIVCVDCTSQLIACGTSAGTVAITDSRCGEIYRCRMNGEVSSVLFSGDGSYLYCMLEGHSKLLNLRYI
ncbi:WD domain-containing protein [Ordospora colligata]|nr:WD domain-containing protein [Ordospora colligata]